MNDMNAAKSDKDHKAVKSEEVDLLIVEDDELSSRSIGRIFRTHFARILSCSRTDEGLTIIENELVPDSIVISDHHNRKSPYHGATLAAKSAQIREHKRVPFYLISGGLHSTQADQELADIQTMMTKKIINGFLKKPFSLEEIKGEVFSHYKAKP